jgi:uncharacterized membrane protein
MGDLLPASFAALGAVIGFVVGATLRSIVWAIFGLGSDLIPIAFGALGSALLLAWLGLRLSRRLANRAVKPS